MERALLQQILSDADGVESSDDGFTVGDEHRASLYLGTAGGTTVLGELVRLKLHEGYVEAAAKDRTVHRLSYEPVIGFSIRSPRDGEAPKTGF